MSCLSSSCRTCRSTSQRLQLQYPIHSCHFSTCRPTQTDTSSSKLPARDWSKYVFTPARPILSEARPAIPREDPRKTNDRVKRGPPGPRPTIGLNGELKTPLGQYRNQRVPIGLSKWGLSQDRGQKENREAPEHFGFGLKRPVQPGQRSAWADRGRADRVPLDGQPRNTRSSPEGVGPHRRNSVASKRASSVTEVKSEPGTFQLNESPSFDEDGPVSQESSGRERRRRGSDRFRRLAPEETIHARQDKDASFSDVSVRRKKERLTGNLDLKTEKEVFIPSTVAVERLATIFNVKLFHLQTRMKRLDMTEDQRRSDYTLTAEEACNLALEYGFNPVVDDEAAFDIFPDPQPVAKNGLPLRPPVVTIMGHVDHGKTTLLDSLRHTSVAAGEAGGITQHIGAFSVPLSTLLPSGGTANDATITFLDTPGHAAFTAMRSRGASVTDIVVLVVAADDGVMPQTKEVIDLVRSEGDKVGLVVAINKVDKPGVDLNKVKSALASEDIHLEEDGGDTPSVQVSGLQKLGLDDLVETISTLAELRDLRARQDGKAEGYVLESNVDRGRGNIATVLVTQGILRAGSSIVAGTTWCRVRQMQDDKGKSIRQALPGSPVSITGWRELPVAGDQLLEAVNGEEEAKRAVSNRVREEERRKLQVDAEQINVKRREERLRAEAEDEEVKAVRDAGGNMFQAQLNLAKKNAELERGKTFKELRLVIKADVSGAVEAIAGSLVGIGNKEAGVKIIHLGVGEVGESDVSLAQTADASIIGFNVPCSRSVQNTAATNNVDLHLESVIYRLIETVRAKTAALLPPRIETRITGEAAVIQLFPINTKRKETVMAAGCRVGNGTISRKEGVRILRGPERSKIYEGTIDTLKHVKKDVDEIRKGSECGISFHGFNDVKEGDEVVTFASFEVAREL